MLKKKDKRVAEALEKLWEFSKSLGRGQVIPWDSIESFMGLDRSHSKTKTLVGKLKRKMEKERGITLWSEPTVGYRLCTAEEQLTVCPEKRSRRAFRQLRKGINHVTAIPDADLTTQGRMLKSQRIENNKRALRQVRASRKADAVLSKPTSSNRPLR